MIPREFDALWKAKIAQEQRQQAVGVHQRGHLIAMVANTGMVKWEAPREAKEFVPQSFRWDQAPVEDFDAQILRTVRFLQPYQDVQVVRAK